MSVRKKLQAKSFLKNNYTPSTEQEQIKEDQSFRTLKSLEDEIHDDYLLENEFSSLEAYNKNWSIEDE